MATIGIQQQRIPMVTLDLRAGTGAITKEWLKILGTLGGETAQDVSALTAALNAALGRIGALEVLLAALTVRVVALEAREAGDSMLLQPAPALEGPQGEQGPQGEPGASVFPPPFTTIPLEWPEELRSALELSGQY